MYCDATKNMGERRYCLLVGHAVPTWRTLEFLFLIDQTIFPPLNVCNLTMLICTLLMPIQTFPKMMFKSTC
jgi:hypothetical protein